MDVKTQDVIAKEQLKTKFVINPISGTGKQENISKNIERLIDKKNFNYDIHFTDSPNHATKITQDAINDNYDLVIAVGGDGTVSECAKALIGSETALAVIPCGSGNGFAYHFKVKRKINDALKGLNNNKIKYIDSCEVNNIPFVNVSGIGFDAHIASLFASTKKRGFFSYIKLTLKELLYKAQEYKIEYNNTSETLYAFAIVFANASQYGNDAKIAPHAKVDDGLIDFVIIKKFPNWKIPLFILDVLRGRTDLNKNVKIIKSKEMRIYTEQPFAHLDGEIKHFTNPIHIKISSKKLKILIPNE
jgi:YegS/Rv2252/BmrU family lipid kinase